LLQSLLILLFPIRVALPHYTLPLEVVISAW